MVVRDVRRPFSDGKGRLQKPRNLAESRGNFPGSGLRQDVGSTWVPVR